MACSQSAHAVPTEPPTAGRVPAAAAAAKRAVLSARCTSAKTLSARKVMVAPSAALGTGVPSGRRVRTSARAGRPCASRVTV
jgi:hypothetical protein